MAADFSMQYSMFWGSQYNYWGSLSMALAYLSGIILWLRTSRWQWLQNAFASIGKMALSNYLGQTIICIFIFYGFGLGFFGQVERGYQLLLVLGIWLLQLLISPLWLKYFRYGFAEWLWRSLTYGKIQPLRI